MLPWEKVTHFVILKQMWSFYWKTAPWIQSLTIVLGIHGKLVLKEYICFKLKKNNGEKGASKPMIQVLWTLFWSFVLGVFIYINVARSMEMSLLVISSPSFPLEDSNARKMCWMTIGMLGYAVSHMVWVQCLGSASVCRATIPLAMSSAGQDALLTVATVLW